MKDPAVKMKNVELKEVKEYKVDRKGEGSGVS